VSEVSNYIDASNQNTECYEYVENEQQIYCFVLGGEFALVAEPTGSFDVLGGLERTCTDLDRQFSHSSHDYGIEANCHRKDYGVHG